MADTANVIADLFDEAWDTRLEDRDFLVHEFGKEQLGVATFMGEKILTMNFPALPPDSVLIVYPSGQTAVVLDWSTYHGGHTHTHDH